MIRNASRFFSLLSFYALMLAVLVGCVLPEDSPTPPPYVIGKPSCVVGEREGCYLVAGIEFDFFNVAETDITSLDISAMVYDRDTRKNPFIGSNRVLASLTGGITAKTKVTLAIPLDAYIYVAPTDPYIIDFFYVSRIDYSDGTSWFDSDGTYYTGSE